MKKLVLALLLTVGVVAGESVNGYVGVAGLYENTHVFQKSDLPVKESALGGQFLIGANLLKQDGVTLGFEGRWLSTDSEFTDYAVIGLLRASYEASPELDVFLLGGYGMLDTGMTSVDGYSYGIGASYAIAADYRFVVDYLSLPNPDDVTYGTADFDVITVGLEYRY